MQGHTDLQIHNTNTNTNTNTLLAIIVLQSYRYEDVWMSKPIGSIALQASITNKN